MPPATVEECRIRVKLERLPVKMIVGLVHQTSERHCERRGYRVFGKFVIPGGSLVAKIHGPGSPGTELGIVSNRHSCIPAISRRPRARSGGLRPIERPAQPTVGCELVRNRHRAPKLLMLLLSAKSSLGSVARSSLVRVRLDRYTENARVFLEPIKEKPAWIRRSTKKALELKLPKVDPRGSRALSSVPGQPDPAESDQEIAIRVQKKKDCSNRS